MDKVSEQTSHERVYTTWTNKHINRYSLSHRIRKFKLKEQRNATAHLLDLKSKMLITVSCGR